MRTVAFGLLLILFSSVVQAGDHSKYAIYGSGVESCGTYDSEADNSGTKIVDIAWALGYLTAKDQWSAWDKVPMATTDGNAVQYWLDNYCKAHPLREFHTAVEALFDQLIKRAIPEK